MAGWLESTTGIQSRGRSAGRHAGAGMAGSKSTSTVSALAEQPPVLGRYPNPQSSILHPSTLAKSFPTARPQRLLIENINAPHSFNDYPELPCSRYAVAMNATGQSRLWTRIMVVLGSIGLLAGALDPMEGSVLILIGSGLMALGTFLGRGDRRLIQYRVWVFLLIAIGVAALWGLSAVGGFGGKSGLSMWWGLLLLPYLIGWPMAIAGPGHPRWFLCLGIGVGLWYLALCHMVLSRLPSESKVAVVIVLAAIGLAIIGGCIIRLVSATRRSRTTSLPPRE
jgi:hypothetical protein